MPVWDFFLLLNSLSKVGPRILYRLYPIRSAFQNAVIINSHVKSLYNFSIEKHQCTSNIYFHAFFSIKKLSFITYYHYYYYQE